MSQRVYYYESDNLKIRESLARYRFALSYVRDKCVLDIGCGARKGPWLVAQTARAVTGVDVSGDAIGYCSRTWPSPKVTYMVCDGASLPFSPGSFDCVLSFEVVEHVKEQAEFLLEAVRVLKKGGLLVISTPNRSVVSPSGVSPNPDHIHEFDVEEFRQFLNPYFTDVRFYGQSPSPRIGAVQDMRRKSYKKVRGIPVGVRHLLPSRLREILFRAYANIFSKIRTRATEYDITEEDFPVREDVVEGASYLLAVCTK